MSGKKVALHNLGCKVNAYETEAMQEMLEKAGYEIVPFREGADIYIINTCTVTNIADRKSRQMLHRARKLNPDAVVVAAGCYVQAQEDQGCPADPCIDIIIGNNRKQDLISVLREYEKESALSEEEGFKTHGGEKDGQWISREHRLQKEVLDISCAGEYETLHLSRTGEHTRAYIKVQDGCNQFCSYCIIPYARGRVRSRNLEDVVDEVTRLAANGYREVVLTGIHLSSYGIDFQDREGEGRGSSLLSLIAAVHEVEGIERIRLGSLEPRIITEEFAKTLASLPKVCPHFHLSLQSGCDATLKRMNRRYTSGEYYEKCCLLRKYFEKPALTTDVIVGFPGETEEEFQTSMAFIDQVNFYETHIFKYSRRRGTRAAGMDGQVPEAVKSRRSAELIELGKRKQEEYERWFFGREVEVLVEETTVYEGKRVYTGHTKEYIRVALDSEEALPNRIIKTVLKNQSQIMH